MSKRNFLLLLFLVMTLIFAGCGKDSGSTDNDTNKTEIVNSSEEKSTEKIDDEIVSVEEFKEYYGVKDTDIPREYILDYIMHYRFRKYTLAKSDYWSELSDDYENGVIYRTDIGSFLYGARSELPLNDYIKTADVIVIEFQMSYGSELQYYRSITLDLRDKKIYYSTRNMSDYTDADKCSDLTDEDVQSIRDELPKHISENQGEVSGYNLDYSFEIMMKDSEYNNKYYRGYSGDELNYPGFDTYWKELYKKKFGEEFVFEE